MDLRELNLKKTAEDLQKAITRDIFIIQTIHTIDLLISEINKLTANLRERYGYYAPKESRIQDRDEFLKEVKKLAKGELGIHFTAEDKNSVSDLVKEIENLILLQQVQEEYLKNLMKNECFNLLETAGLLIGARLISLAGSLKRLAELPSSTIQVLGAEKSLFKHLKNKSAPPKFGVIFGHESILKADNKGKAARRLASKISIAVKKDYFGKK